MFTTVNYRGLFVAMFILASVCLTLLIWAFMILARYCKLKRIQPIQDDEGVIHYPEKIYDRHTIVGLTILNISIVSKLVYFWLICTNLQNETTIPFNIIVGMQIISIMCLCGSMAVELNLWLRYQVRIKTYGNAKSQNEYLKDLKQKQELYYVFVIFLSIIYFLFVFLTLREKVSFDKWDEKTEA